MKHQGRYTVPTDEDFEPDSNHEVLKNYLGIKTKEKIEALEKQELERTELELIKVFDENSQFTADDICNIHKLWLGDIYPSAGKYRTVRMEKDGFPFAMPNRISQLMTELENKYLAKYTPCHFTDLNELTFALAITHVELILIHPFREGNGRTARLQADLMVMQAKKPPLNFALIDQTKANNHFNEYILAIHAGLNTNYEPMQNIFKKLLGQSLI